MKKTNYYNQFDLFSFFYYLLKGTQVIRVEAINFSYVPRTCAIVCSFEKHFRGFITVKSAKEPATCLFFDEKTFPTRRSVILRCASSCFRRAKAIAQRDTEEDVRPRFCAFDLFKRGAFEKE